MQNAFGTLVAVGIVAGGFLLTGDLGWCARQISQAFDPSAAPAAPPPAAAPPAAAASPVVTPAETAPPAPPAADAGRQPAAPRPAPRRPPAAGLELVDLTIASPGQRVVVWTTARGRLPECHVIHVLDAEGSEALLQRRGETGDGPARRVAIAAAADAASGRTDTCVLRLHGSFHVRPLGLAPGLDRIVEMHGPITGLAVE